MDEGSARSGALLPHGSTVIPAPFPNLVAVASFANLTCEHPRGCCLERPRQGVTNW